jgi:hypothetical protein
MIFWSTRIFADDASHHSQIYTDIVMKNPCESASEIN